VTGFGQDGPYANRPGYDAMIQGMSGIMDLTGDPDGSPQKVGVAFADIFTGLYGVVAIQAALAELRNSEKGQHIDMSLLDCMVGVLANQALNYLVSGRSPRRLGTAHPNIVPYQVFDTCDGQIMLAVGNDEQYQRLCEILAMPTLAHDPRFITNAARVRNRESLVAALRIELQRFTRHDILEKLDMHGIPAGPINSVEEAFNDPQVIHRGMRLALHAPHADGESIPGIRTPIRYSRSSLNTARRAPQLGEHTAEILRELGSRTASASVRRD
jgi:crotonobetainyl-CoA:carnitine CoA-transferase CaiB-like acyl-CoA transferase